MGCVASIEREDAETRAKKRDVRVMKATFPLALLEHYEVQESEAYDAYGGTFQVVNKDDMSTRWATVVRLTSAGGPDTLPEEQFSTQEYVMQMISHDGMLALYDSFIEMRQRPALGVFITERVDGPKLKDVAQREPRLDEDDVRGIMVQLAEVLKRLSEYGVVCGDLNLDTVQFRDEYEDDVVVTSMRYATLVAATIGWETKLETYEVIDEMGNKVKRTYPNTGQQLGFLAPECLKPSKRGILPSADIWAFGVIMYTLLAGYLPFDAEIEGLDYAAACCEKIRAGNFTAFTYDTETWANISPGAKDLIAGCLRVDRRRRFTISRVLNHPWIRKFHNPDATFSPSLHTPPASSLGNASSSELDAD